MQSSITNVLLEAKRKKNISYAHLGESLGRDPVWVASLFYGQARASEQEAATLLSLLELDSSLAEILTDFPVKGALDAVVPTDPFLYRFYEILQVYGMPMKGVIQEEFGDGIVSAVDFSLSVHRQEDPKGDRVVITMNGKFLPYKKW